MKYIVTFEAEMDEDDVGAMNECFEQAMEQEMHITCSNMQINQQ